MPSNIQIDFDATLFIYDTALGGWVRRHDGAPLADVINEMMRAHIKVLKCQCGSGSDALGPAHSYYCQCLRKDG